MQNDNNYPTAIIGAAARRLGCFGALTLALAAITIGGQPANADNDGIVGITTPAGERAAVVAFDNNGDNGDGGFATFRQRMQLRLLSALDDELARQSQDAIGGFGFVKKAQVQLQTPLGGREGQLGINLIGAFTDSDNHAIGWQVRAYGDTENSKGGNVGVFFRRIVGDDTMAGINAFADYEKHHDHGDFSRYSFGGEVRNNIFALAANYYAPITDDKNIGGTSSNRRVVAYSREGYDAKLRVGIAQFKYLKAGADYYRFDGKHGAEADDGFRYGAELHPFDGFRADIFYDNGGGEWGGEVSYAHSFGGGQSRPSADATYTPDLFAPVWREHSQRIAIATVTLDTAREMLMTTTTTITAGTTTTLTTTTTVTTTMMTTMPDDNAPIIANARSHLGTVFVTGFLGAAALVEASGGNRNYSYSFVGDSGAFRFDRANPNLVLFQSDTAGPQTATIAVDDNANPQTSPVSVMLTILAIGQGQCNFITGCPWLGHEQLFTAAVTNSTTVTTIVRERQQGVFVPVNTVTTAMTISATITLRTLPALPTATMLVDIGVDTDGVLIAGGSRIGAIAYYTEVFRLDHTVHSRFRDIASNASRFRDIVDFLIERGADINYQRQGGTYAGQTALDIINLLNFNERGMPKQILLDRSARCSINCRVDDMNISGATCTRDTHPYQQGTSAANCHP